jgi:ATP-dependent Clp protease ATP-binding subunit ClpA
MYERFTDRARKTMALANGEAQRFNHEYIGTEHILLGLIKEGCGVGAKVLKNLDIDLRKIRLEIEKLVKSGPEMVSLGKLPQTPRARKAIEYAIEEARNLNHNYVGTEHILLGLLREHDGVASAVLMNLGLKLEEVREEVLNLLGAGTVQINEESLRPTQSQLAATLAELLNKKDEAIKNSEYDVAAALRDQAEEIRRQLPDDVKIAPVGDVGQTTYKWVIEAPSWNTAENKTPSVLSRVEDASDAVRDLLSVAAISSDISVIEFLTQTIHEFERLREYFEDLARDNET